MSKRQNIDRILREWEFDPGEISVRLIEAGDGREVLQMRVELGLLQLEVDRRPDGRRPEAGKVSRAGRAASGSRLPVSGERRRQSV